MENLYPRAFLSENSLKFDEVKKYAVKIIKLQKKSVTLQNENCMSVQTFFPNFKWIFWPKSSSYRLDLSRRDERGK